MAQEPSSEMFDQFYSLSSRGAYGELVRYIRDHDDEDVRYGAAGVLSESVSGFAEQMTPPVRKALVDVVLNDPSDAVRANVVKTLLAIDESIADNIITRLEIAPKSTPTDTPYPLLLTKWHERQWPELRFLAAVGFGRVGSHTTIEKLRTTIQRETDLRVIRRAIEAGGTVGDETFVTPIKNYLRIDDESMYQSADAEEIKRTKQAAVEALVTLGTNGAYEALHTASRGTDAELKACALSEIGRLEPDEAVDLIVDELHNGDDDVVREEAAGGLITTFTESDFEDGHTVREQALAEMGDDVDAAVSAEFASIVDESPRKPEQRNAAWVLTQLGSTTEETVESLLSALDDDDDYLRIIAAAGLTTLDPSLVEAKLEEFLASVDEESVAHNLASSVRSNLQDGPEKVIWGS